MLTGSSVGLGRATVEAALAAGHRVVATARKVSTLDDLVLRYPENLLAIALAVGRRQDWDAAVAAAIKRFGVIDVLVNNAGFGAVGAVESTPVDVVRRLVDTNLMGAVHACQAIIPAMRRQGHGARESRCRTGSLAYGARAGYALQNRCQVTAVCNGSSAAAGGRVHARLLIPAAVPL